MLGRDRGERGRRTKSENVGDEEMNCDECLHNIVCELWRKEESQDASNITDPLGDYGCLCFEPVHRKRGIWKIRGMAETYVTDYDCPCCGVVTAVAGNRAPSFCPNCGAKMITDF